jgi:hypothetical protein
VEHAGRLAVARRAAGLEGLIEVDVAGKLVRPNVRVDLQAEDRFGGDRRKIGLAIKVLMPLSVAPDEGRLIVGRNVGDHGRVVGAGERRPITAVAARRWC